MKSKRARRYLVLAGILLLLVLFLAGLLTVGCGRSGEKTVPEVMQDVTGEEGATNDPPDADGSALEDGDTSELSRSTDDAAISSRQSDQETELIDSATRVLEDYRGRGDCLLRWAGYLDLFGEAWGCVVEGPDSVDIVIIRERDGGSTERVVRFNPREWEEELEKSGL